MKPKLLYPLLVVSTSLGSTLCLSVPTAAAESAAATVAAANVENSNPVAQRPGTGTQQVIYADETAALEDIRERAKQQAAKADFDLAIRSADEDNLGRAAELLGEAVALQPRNTGYLHAASRVAYKLKHYKATEVYLNNLLAIYREASIPVDTKRLAVLDDLATLYQVQGRKSAAKSALIEGLTSRTALYGEHHPRIVETLCRLAELDLVSADLGEANKRLQQAVDILDTSVTAIDDRDAAALMHNIGELYRVSGQYAEAESAYTKAMTLWNRSPAPDQRGLAMTQEGLTRVRAQQYTAPSMVDAEKGPQMDRAHPISSLPHDSTQAQL